MDTNNVENAPKEDLNRILESAKRLGVKMDEKGAHQWLNAMQANQDTGEVVLDTRNGVFGNKISMLDFSPKDLDYFRRIGRLVEFADEPGVVETALALSGSAAQSKIQTYPGDCDYFERINIRAGTQKEACTILGRIMREKVLSAEKGPTYQLMEVKYGSYPSDMVRDGEMKKSGSPVSWSAEEIRRGFIETSTIDGKPISLKWEDLADKPGWCKLDWIIADPQRGSLANASNMLDVTWEAPDGSITPLDGYLDPYFQEVYLDSASVPIFSKLAQHVSANALDEYVRDLEHEVQKYLTTHVNYGKAAKRMYNVFRLTGRYNEAAYIRELFDEPASMLYQVWALIRTIEDCSNPTSPVTAEQMIAQCDQLIVSVVDALEGDEEKEIVRLLLRLRDTLDDVKTNQKLTREAEAARAEVINVVNNFFYEKLTSIPQIKSYIENIQKPA
jgi:hypothetical protein